MSKGGKTMLSNDMPNEIRKYIAKSDDGHFWKVIDVDHQSGGEGEDRWDWWQVVTYSALKGSVIVKTFMIDAFLGERRVSEYMSEIWVSDIKRWMSKIDKEGVA
jgi:hypothetical protein